MVGRRRPPARRVGAREDQHHDERAARGTRRGAGAAPGVTPRWWRQESPIGTLTVLATDRGVQQIELGPTAFDVDAVEGCDDDVAAGGRIGGYGPSGVPTKRFLLALEGVELPA